MAITQSEMGESALNSSLRPVVAAIDRELARLGDGSPVGSGTGMGEIRRSWRDLVALLALGPAPQIRKCPVCSHTGMRAATRCGFCWTPLASLPDGAGTLPESSLYEGG